MWTACIFNAALSLIYMLTWYLQKSKLMSQTTGPPGRYLSESVHAWDPIIPRNKLKYANWDSDGNPRESKVFV